MKRNILFVIWVITLLCTSKASVFANQEAVSSKLENGIYLIQAEISNPARAKRLPQGFVMCEYTSDHLVSRVTGESDPVRYIVIKDTPSVPVVLADKPQLSNTNDKYELALQFTLAPEYIDLMEKFTGDNLNKRIALVIGGKIITMHKIRSAIKNGLIRITRCTDNGCKLIYQNLVKTN